MKVQLSYNEFLNATQPAGVRVFYHHDLPPEADIEHEPGTKGTFVAQAMVNGVTLEYRGDQKPATFDTDFAGSALDVLGIPE